MAMLSKDKPLFDAQEEPKELRAMRGARLHIKSADMGRPLGAHFAAAALGPSVRVQLQDLTSDPELRGAEGICQYWDLEKKMWVVRLRCGRQIDVETGMLHAMEKLALRPLVPVQIADFHLLPKLNGMMGCCVKWLPSILCWQVRLSETMESIVVEPENLRVMVPDPDALRLGFCHPDFWAGLKGALSSLSPEFLAESEELRDVANAETKGLLPRLKQLRARQKVVDMYISVYNPVFSRFGISEGQTGFDLLGSESSRLCLRHPQFRDHFTENLAMAGCGHIQAPEDQIKQMEKETRLKEQLDKFKRAPPEILEPLCTALNIPVDATPDQIAAQLPFLKEHAKALAERLIQKKDGQLAIFKSTVAFGGLDDLSMELRERGGTEFGSALQESAEAYLHTLFDKVLRPSQDFASASDWQCPWADRLIQWWHATALFRKPLDGKCTKAGYAIVDRAIDQELAGAVRSELSEIAQQGRLSSSNNLCNRGARYIWLAFGTEEERLEMPPALQEVCLKLAGASWAVQDAYRKSAGAAVPELCIAPEVMAASYDKGAEYHVHRDSDGTNNARMFTILLYLNAGWVQGDGGELRIHASTYEEGKPQPVMNEFVDIPPLCGRLVIFHSRDIWHAVCEPRTQRWALTLWVMSR